MQDSINSFERYRIGSYPYETKENTVSTFQVPPIRYYKERRKLDYHDSYDQGIHVKIILNENLPCNDSLNDYKKLEDTEYSRVIKIPNGNIKISQYKMIKNDKYQDHSKDNNDEIRPYKVSYLNRSIYLPSPQTIRSELNDEVLFRKSFKTNLSEEKSLSSKSSEEYSNFSSDIESLRNVESNDKNSFLEDLRSSDDSSETKVSNPDDVLEEEQKDFIIKQLSFIAKSKAENHVPKSSSYHIF
ncbi:unnamed protein product [Brachionus calyciflorus]|uniref:Uncharacterized protein n=1 Tax=Brachionus calyciflorus TaxID=104777 RepID=A0A813RWD3_9BILA|nr:unnamed protein product [Brachionus calyciflorus]